MFCQVNHGLGIKVSQVIYQQFSLAYQLHCFLYVAYSFWSADMPSAMIISSYLPLL